MKLFGHNIDNTSSRILKALSIFGSVQALSVLTSAIRIKVIAVLIGPVGVGIYSIFWQTMDLIRNIGGLSITTPAVKEIASLKSDPERCEEMIRRIRRLGAWLGTLTALITAIGAPVLSLIMFGNMGYTLWFAALAPMVALMIVANVNLSVIQAQERLRALAMSTLWAAMISSLGAVFFIWLLGLRGVVPALLMLGLVQYIFSWVYSDRRMSLSGAWQKVRDTFATSRHILSMGGYMTISMGASLLCSYAFIVYLNRAFDTTVVGIYQAGYTMLNAYAGTFFTAMSVEYYPRLARQARTAKQVSAVVNHELSLIMRILIPLVVIFVAVAWLLVRILYTKAFLGAVPYIMFGAPGLLFKAVSTAMAYTILAKGDGRTYVITEFASSSIGLILNIVGFRLYGFAGAGVAYSLWYAFYTVITFYVYRYRYGCVMRGRVWASLAWGLLAVGAAIAVMLILPVTRGL